MDNNPKIGYAICRSVIKQSNYKSGDCPKKSGLQKNRKEG